MAKGYQRMSVTTYRQMLVHAVKTGVITQKSAYKMFNKFLAAQ